MTKRTFKSSGLFGLLTLIMGILQLASYQVHAAKTLYFEDFQTYSTANPAPNPLISGTPAGGQWYFIDPAAPLATSEHFTPTSSNIGGSRGWGTSVANGIITNAISLATLQLGASHTFRLSFVAAGNNATPANACIFNYEISSSSGTLTFVSGRNLDDSQTFTSLSGTGRAPGGTVKSADRTFEFVFQGDGLTSADTINFSITRVGGDPVANVILLLDDVRLESQDDITFAVDSIKGLPTFNQVRVFFNEDIGPEATTNAANYSLSGGASVQGVTLLNPSSVELTTTTLTPGAQYNLQVNAVTNLSGEVVSSAPVNFTMPTIPAAKTLYVDDFQNYPTQNPAPNPLVGSPMGGVWYFVDPAAPLAAGDHITTASANIENSRGWASTVANARITNAISLAKLRPGASHTYRLTFVAACVSTPLANACIFDYEITSSSGAPLTLVSGRNLDDSQTFTGLSGTARAVGGTIKGLNRTFEFVFQGEGLTPADTINFSISRVIGAPVVAVTFLLDDVRLQVQDNIPFGVEYANGVLTKKHVRVSFTEDGVGPEAATNAANYSISGGVSVQGVTLLSGGVVELSTTPLTPGVPYSLQISGVTNLNGNVISGGPVSFTVPTDAPAIRYDAGNSTTFPSGPVNPTNLVCDGIWTFTGSEIPGISATPVTDDNGTGLNAWQMMDQSVVAGAVTFNLTPSTGAVQFAATNAWRLTARIRFVDNFYYLTPAQFVIFGDASVRRGAFGLGINADGYLILNPLGGATYPLPNLDPLAYHTYDVVFDPVRGASYYVDDQLVAADQRPQVVAAVGGLTFGSGSTAGTGMANYNLVQLNVVGATQPVVTQPLPDMSGVVGQTVTFNAGITGWVNQYQWTSNGIVIPGAIGASYTTPPLTQSFNGTVYRCRAMHALGCVETDPAVLTVFTQPPSVSIGLNGLNAEVTYVGILESTTVIGPASWTPVATNLSGGTYSVPVSGAPQKYFRARLP